MRLRAYALPFFCLACFRQRGGSLGRVFSVVFFFDGATWHMPKVWLCSCMGACTPPRPLCWPAPIWPIAFFLFLRAYWLCFCVFIFVFLFFGLVLGCVLICVFCVFICVCQVGGVGCDGQAQATPGATRPPPFGVGQAEAQPLPVALVHALARPGLVALLKVHLRIGAGNRLGTCHVTCMPRAHSYPPTLAIL